MDLKTRVGRSLAVFLTGLIILTLTACSAFDVTCEPVDPDTTSCSLGKLSAEQEITADEAVEKGFPLLIPTSEQMENIGLVFPPDILMKVYDETCSYLDINFYSVEPNGNPAINLNLSNGCASLRPIHYYDGPELKLDWAKDQKVFTKIGENTTYLRFEETFDGFVYVVSTTQPLTLTLEFLNSMKPIQNQPELISDYDFHYLLRNREQRIYI